MIDNDGRRGSRHSKLDIDDALGSKETRRRGLVLVALAIVVIAAVAAGIVFVVPSCSPAKRADLGEATSSALRGFDDAVVSLSQQAVLSADKGGLSSRVVCIDPGHGAYADLTLTPIGPGSSEMQYVEPGGTSGVVSGWEEYELVLDIALRLRDRLEASGVQVVMVRTDNEVVMSSEERAVIANEAGADIFLRLHADGSDSPSLRGFTTLIPGYNEWTEPIVESSRAAAEFIHPMVIEMTGAYDGGIVERYDLAGFNFCQVPSLLFEVGYMSNPEEDALMATEEYRQLLADSIAEATVAYLESTY